MNTRPARIRMLAALLPATLALGACAHRPPPPTGASYSSYLNEPSTVSRGLVALSDEETERVGVGGASARKTASSEQVFRNGRPESQSIVEEEVVETRISTVIETSTVAAPDQEMP